MAFGFTPKHEHSFELNILNQQQALALITDVVTQLNWEINFISDNGIIAYTPQSWKAWSNEVTIKISGNSIQIKSACTGSEITDWGKNKKNVEEFTNAFQEAQKTADIELLNNKYQEFKDQLAQPEEDILNLPPETTKQKITGFFSIFIPTQGYFITPILLNLNILIYLVMVISGVDFFSPDSESLLKWGANFRPATLNGEWWRLLTCCFIHIGLIHLLMNMYALVYIGLILEPFFGKARFLAAYILSGIAASVASLWWNELVVSAGASGAIFGMYGVFIALLTTKLLDDSIKKALTTSILIFVGYNLLNGMKGGIDNAAHIGGLISGAIIGYAFIPSLKNYYSAKVKFASISIISVLIAILSVAFIKNTNNDIGKYSKEMERFSELENKALKVYSMAQNSTNEAILNEITKNGIPTWQEGVKLIDSFKNLDLPEDIKNRNQVLKEYCELRIKSYELIYKAVAENTEQYQAEIQNYNTQIEQKIKEISGGGE